MLFILTFTNLFAEGLTQGQLSDQGTSRYTDEAEGGTAFSRSAATRLWVVDTV
jgi:hypothetical protein